jgi:hypothetical protein
MLSHAGTAMAAVVNVSPSVVREGRDFATLSLTDPWDMNEFSDVSKYFNESNVAIHLQNSIFSGGIFSATSADTDAQFYTLFPGYGSAINAGRVGSRYPIDPSQYHCLYIRMNVLTDNTTGDEWRAFWFAGNTLAGGVYGATGRRILAGPRWNIYYSDPYLGGTPWGGASQWQGLRIDPTTKAGVSFAVDWVRLTDCVAVSTTISWTGLSGNVQIWGGIDRQAPDIEVAPVVNGSAGAYQVDVQGWEPGTYYLALKDAGGVFHWSATPLQIDPSPRITFAKPSYTSGDSLTWDMNSSSDLSLLDTKCVSFSFADGVVDLVTQSAPNQPFGCFHNSGATTSSDPQLGLSMPPPPVDTSTYRYLTFRTYMEPPLERPWQDVNAGWMYRWLWRTYENGDPAKWCMNVSNDIPFDVGWETLAVDLFNPFEGYTEDFAGPSGCHARYWADDPANFLRIDPNENTTSSAFHQKIDWIRLSRMDRVAQGSPFAIQLESSEPITSLNLAFYYTTDPAQPKQHSAILGAGGTPPSLPYSLYLPLVLKNSGVSGPTSFSWNTDRVTPGQYYVCVEAGDGYNTPIFCSQTAVEVTQP